MEIVTKVLLGAINRSNEPLISFNPVFNSMYSFNIKWKYGVPGAGVVILKFHINEEVIKSFITELPFNKLGVEFYDCTPSVISRCVLNDVKLLKHSIGMDCSDTCRIKVKLGFDSVEFNKELEIIRQFTRDVDLT